jgi:uncharacterized protein (DUF885 family)
MSNSLNAGFSDSQKAEILAALASVNATALSTTKSLEKQDFVRKKKELIDCKNKCLAGLELVASNAKKMKVIRIYFVSGQVIHGTNTTMSSTMNVCVLLNL